MAVVLCNVLCLFLFVLFVCLFFGGGCRIGGCCCFVFLCFYSCVLL